MTHRNPRVVIEFAADSAFPVNWRLECTDLAEQKRLLARVAFVVRQLEGVLRRGRLR